MICRLGAVLLTAALIVAASDASGAQRELVSIPGYVPVTVYYGWNKMLMDVLVNGRKARFAIDTGASFSVFNEDRARAFGIAPVSSNSVYGEFTNVNRETHRIGYIKNLRAGAMDFGNGPMVLFGQSQLGGPSQASGVKVDGIIGADILTRYKAVINCLTKTIYFKTDSGAHLLRFAQSQHFTRVPLREEVSRNFTVPATVNGHACRLLVDTGGSNTVFSREKAREFGLAFKRTNMSVSFADGIDRRISMAEFKNLKIGEFRVPAQKLASVTLPDFAVDHGGDVRIAGIIGMELLVLNRGIIDFGSMNLFFK